MIEIKADRITTAEILVNGEEIPGITGPTGEVGPTGSTGFPGDGWIPPGTVMMYVGTTAPDGWLLLDGSAISRTTYSALFD